MAVVTLSDRFLALWLGLGTQCFEGPWKWAPLLPFFYLLPLAVAYPALGLWALVYLEPFLKTTAEEGYRDTKRPGVAESSLLHRPWDPHWKSSTFRTLLLRGGWVLIAWWVPWFSSLEAVRIFPGTLGPLQRHNRRLGKGLTSLMLLSLWGKPQRIPLRPLKGPCVCFDRIFLLCFFAFLFCFVGFSGTPVN